jgi:hypothetical protein
MLFVIKKRKKNLWSSHWEQENGGSMLGGIGCDSGGAMEFFIFHGCANNTRIEGL